MALVVRKEKFLDNDSDHYQNKKDMTSTTSLFDDEYATFPNSNWFNYLDFEDGCFGYNPCGSTYHTSEFKSTPIFVDETQIDQNQEQPNKNNKSQPQPSNEGGYFLRSRVNKNRDNQEISVE